MTSRVRHPLLSRSLDAVSLCEDDGIDNPFDVPDPLAPLEEPDDPSDLDDFDFPCTDDAQWDVFIPDDDDRDPQPDPGDFWDSEEPGAWSKEFD